MPTDVLELEYIRNARQHPVEITRDRAFRLEELRFHVSVE